MKIYHNDIKLENVCLKFNVITQIYSLIFIDFGLSNIGSNFD